MNNHEKLKQVREAIFNNFEKYIDSDPKRARKIIENDTFTGEEDPGEWSPNAVAIIHCESGIPNGMYSGELFEKWFDVSRDLEGMFCEHINGAVIGVYEE